MGIFASHHVQTTMVSFDNTEIAFSGKTDTDLRRSYWLFTLVSNPMFVNMGKSLTHFAIQAKLPINGFIKATIFKQFVGGENISECGKTIAELGKYHIGTILDYSVEGAETENAFNSCEQETLETIHRAEKDKNIPFCVFKVTGMARFALLEKVSAEESLSEREKSEYAAVTKRVHEICKTAHYADVPVFIDAEESWIQPAIDGFANAMMSEFNKEKPIIFNTFQLYRKDRLSYLRHSFELAINSGYHLIWKRKEQGQKKMLIRVRYKMTKQVQTKTTMLR
jgi:proline dehydrogenase